MATIAITIVPHSPNDPYFRSLKVGKVYSRDVGKVHRIWIYNSTYQSVHYLEEGIAGNKLNLITKH